MFNIRVASALLLGVATIVSLYNLSSFVNKPVALGAFDDPFVSLQLATSPQNGYCLLTDGTNNSWTTCPTGGGSSNWLFDGTRLSPSTTVGVGIFSSSTITDLSMTNATVTTSLNLFGTIGRALSDFCVAITGGSGLCDGVDNTSAGGGGIATSSVPTAGNLAYWTSASALSDVATGTLSENVTGLEFDQTRGLVGGAAVLSLTSGYGIPLTASTTNWNNFYDTPSSVISGGTNLTWSSNTLNVDDPFAVTNFTATKATATNATATTMYATNYYGSGQNLSLASLGSSTYTTLQHLQNIFHSSGYVSGGAITQATPSTVNVAAGSGLIRDSNSGVATVYYFDWSASSSIAIPSNTITYLGIDYNGGSPIVIKKTTRNWDFKTQFELGQVVTDGTDMHIASIPDAVGDHAMNMVQRMYDEMKIARDEATGGLLIGAQGTRGLSLTAGNLWTKLTKISVSASSTLSWDAYYGSDGGGWSETFQTQWDNANYDDAGVLTPLTANRWAVHWLYIETDGSVVLVYSPAQYTSQAAAEAASAPSTLPDRLDMHGRLFSKLVFQEGASSGTIYSLWGSMGTAGTAASDHGNLSGLTDDDHTQYLLANGTRALTANWSVGGFSLYGLNSLTLTGTSTLGYASTTALTVSGNSYVGTVKSGTWNGTKVDVSDYTNLTVSATGLELSGDALALSAGYVIPTTTRAVNWDTAYSWGNHALQGYLTTVDISANTNLAVDGTEIVLTDDTLSLGTELTFTNATSSTSFFSALGTFTNLVINTLANFVNVVVTGLLDVGGGTLEIPNGTNPTANDPGEIAHDTSDNQIIIDDYVIRTKEEIYKFSVPSTSPAFATSTVKYMPPVGDGYTVTNIFCSVEGGTSKSITIYGETIACDTDGQADDGSISISSVAAASTTVGMTAGAGAGNVNWLNVTVTGQWTRE